MLKYTFDYVRKGLKKEDCLIAILIAEKIAVPITWLLLNFTKLKPNHITLFRLFILFPIIIYSFLNVSDKRFALLGAFTFFLDYILDIVDGLMARVGKMKTYFGAFLDGVSDRLSYLVFIAALFGVSSSAYWYDYNLFLKYYSYAFLFLYLSYLTSDRVFVKHFDIRDINLKKAHISYEAANTVIKKMIKKRVFTLRDGRRLIIFGHIYDAFVAAFVLFPILFFFDLINLWALSFVFVVFTLGIVVFIISYFRVLCMNKKNVVSSNE